MTSYLWSVTYRSEDRDLNARTDFRGILTAIVTPFSTEGEVDEQAFRELVHFQLERKVNGLFVAGTNGLGPLMRIDQRKRIAELVVDEATGRIPVIIHVGSSDVDVSFDLAAHAENVGADAIASVPPFYYQLGQDSILDYFERLSRTVNMPIFIYNIPRFAGNNVDADLLVKLSKIKNVVGVKDSSRDFTQLMDFLEAAPKDFVVINGNDSYLYPALCVGANGGVSATANVFPELLVEMYNSFVQGDYGKASALQFKIHSATKIIGKPPFAGIFTALKVRGLRSGNLRLPLRNASEVEQATIATRISEMFPDLV